MGSRSIPVAPEDLTAGWLTEALRGAGPLGARGRVVAVDAKPIGEGVGFTGQVVRARMELADAPAAAPRSVIVKLPTQYAPAREAIRSFRIYEREIRFYRAVAPTLSLRVPASYYSDTDPDADAHVLILEDIADGRVGDQLTGCTVAECELILRELARFHAEWWSSPRLSELDWVPMVNSEIQRGAQGVGEASWAKFVETFGHLMPPPLQAVGERYVHSINWLQERFAAMPNVLMHTDFRLDNLLFGANADGSPVCIIDWQAITRGGAAMDIGYFLSQSLPTAVRRKRGMELLHVYHDALEAGGVMGYPFERCYEDFKLGVLWGFLIPIFGAASLDISNERGYRLIEALAERAANAIVDLKAYELLP